MKKLAGMTALVAAGYVAFAVAGDAQQETVDAGILIYITSVYTLGIITMLAYTRSWSLIGCGLLATMTGDALLYGRLSRHMPFPEGPWALDLARSCFIVGGTYLVVGLVLWVRAQADDDAEMLTEDAP